MRQGFNRKNPSRTPEISLIQDEVEFYNQNAPYYDERNTNTLVETHRSIIAKVTKFLGERDNLEVLDLGGGTGRLIAAHFFDERRLKWTYFDNAPGMLQEFRSNLAETKLQTEEILGDIYDLSDLRGREFDVVVLSLILTSLQNLPDFGLIASLVGPSGHLIIADIDPVYSADNPIYSVTLPDGSRVGLRVNSRHPLDVIEWVTKTGLNVLESAVIMKQDGTRYSYVITAKRMVGQRPSLAASR